MCRFALGRRFFFFVQRPGSITIITATRLRVLVSGVIIIGDKWIKQSKKKKKKPARLSVQQQ